jgi:hypothetical protein
MAKQEKAKGSAASRFRDELVKIMPGYSWTVHESSTDAHLKATGTQSSGFNRLSTLSVIRTERDGEVEYESKSAGYGLRAKWLHRSTDSTLARSLRGLQDHYEYAANTYRGHAASLQAGRQSVATIKQNIDQIGGAS